MKKAIAVLSATLLTISAHAVAVTWNFGTLYAPNVDGSFGAAVAPGATGYTATVYFFTDAGCTTSFNPIDGTTSSTINGLSSISAQASQINQLFANETTYYALFVITANTANGQFEMVSTKPYTVVFGKTGNAPTITFGTGGYMPSAWTVIPEPATMALLGVGVVAFGLRRRRK